MRCFLILLCTISLNLSFSQGKRMQGAGGFSQGGNIVPNHQQNQRRDLPEFNASNMAGIFKYDLSNIIKKFKLKKNKDLVSKVSDAILNYNKNINDIINTNRDNFDTLNVYMNNIIKATAIQRSQNSGNTVEGRRTQGQKQTREGNSPMQKAKEQSREKLRPARIKVKQIETDLNGTFKLLFNKKQYDKWLIYQEQRKEALRPNQNTSSNINTKRSPGSQGNRQGNNSMMRNGGGGNRR